MNEGKLSRPKNPNFGEKNEDLTSASEGRRWRPSPSARLVVCFVGRHRQVYVPTVQ